MKHFLLGTALARPYNGTLESVESISLEDIKTFIGTHLGYNNVIAVVGGDITEKEAEVYTKEILGTFLESQKKVLLKK